MTTAEPAWRQRLISRSVDAARTRAEERIERFIDAAFELVDEKGSTEFTVQELLERSKQSLRGFYEYFGSKDELVLALFDETVREAAEDIRVAVALEHEPIDASARVRHHPPRVVRPGRGAPQARDAHATPDLRAVHAAGREPHRPHPRRAAPGLPPVRATSSTKRPTPGSSPSTTAGPHAHSCSRRSCTAGSGTG